MPDANAGAQVATSEDMQPTSEEEDFDLPCFDLLGRGAQQQVAQPVLERRVTRSSGRAQGNHRQGGSNRKVASASNLGSMNKRSSRQQQEMRQQQGLKR